MMAREGIPFVLAGLLLTFAGIWLANRWNSLAVFLLSAVVGLLTLFVVFFFRDPDRRIDFQAGTVLSPADGEIVQVRELATDPFVGADAVQVSIFLSVFDVHINRVPATGSIDYVKYNPGKFLAAFNDKASRLNEQTDIGMTTDKGVRLRFKQIAGIIARRIVCRLKQGENVSAGTRFGMIRFGSRVDIIMPAGSHLSVGVGDKVFGGTTVLGTLPNPAVSPRLSEEKADDHGH